jgi:D-inositol-3-phosphate glycosyltransferase
MILRPVETYYEEHFRLCADATTVINAALEQRALGLGVAAETIMRLPHVSDPELVHPQDRATARAALGLPAGEPILGYVGALFPDDAALLINALARVRATKPETQLILIGDPKTKVPETPGVTRTGFVSAVDLNRYLAACDVLCLPLTDSLANRGRYPSKVADYFSAGRPTVACAVGEIASVLKTAQAGLLSEPTATSFANQVLVLLEDAGLRERLGKNARCAAETFYNWANVSERVLALYLRLSDLNGGKE